MRWSVVVVLALAIAGCATTAPKPATTTAPSTPAATGGAFSQPKTCASLLPLEGIDDALVLLGGPDGEFGNDYLAEPTPEQEAGGITCIWGEKGAEVSSVTVSVAPLTTTSHDTVVASLEQQGLNELPSAEGTAYAVVGDTDGTPAILNVVEPASWISVIETVGGEAGYEKAVDLAAAVREAVYAG